MGNMPDRWAGRGVAVALALLAAVGGYFAGDAAGVRLTTGFTFDWYEHALSASYPAADVLFAVAVAALAAAVVGVAFGVPLATLATRLAAKRMRFVPPRMSRAVGLDTHGVRLLVFAGAGAALVATLLSYLALASPLALGSGSVIERLSPGAYRLMVAAAAAIGAGMGVGLSGWTTFHGILGGHLVKDPEQNVIAKLSLFGVRQAKSTVAAVVLLTVVAGIGTSMLTTNVDVADVLPRGDPNTAAAHNLSAKFKSSFTQQVTFQFRVLDMENGTHAKLYDDENAKWLPNRVLEPRPENVTDELYVRAMTQAIDFVLKQGEFATRTDYETPFVGSIGSPTLYKLINWTIAGGTTQQNTEGDAAFALPDTSRDGELRYASVDQGVNRVSTVYSAVDALSSPNWTQTSFMVTVDPNADLSTKEIGEAALRMRDAWIEEVRTEPDLYRVFGPDNPPMFSVDLPIANAHASELTKHDFSLLLPIIGVFIALTLFIAFRNAASVVVTFSMLAIAVVWTFGAMGALGIALNTLNLAVVPLIMGVGIDYGIHMMNEYQEQRHRGRTAEEAWTHAGRGSALALFVGMLTTVAGLVVMIVSPSLLVAQLGLLAIIALLSCYVLAVLFIPALTTLFGRASRAKTHDFTPSRLMPTFATGVSRARWFALVVLVLLAGAAAASASGIRREAFGDPPRNWLESDPLRQEHERAIAGFYERTTDDVKANVLIFEGDITDPAAHTYIDAITATLRSYEVAGSYVDADGNTRESRVIGDTLRDLPFLMRTYLTVRDGVPGATPYLGASALDALFAPAGGDPTGTRAYPATREEMKATLDEVFESPLYQFGNLFVDSPSYDMAVTIFSVEAGTYDDAEAVWNEVHAAIAANEDIKPDHLRVSFFGNTAINYLFVAKQVPWLQVMSIVTAIVVTLIVFLLTRDVRSTLVVASLNILASAFWLGALTLPWIDIGLAISLTLPLIFIYAMGSDYGLHLAMRCRKDGDSWHAFGSVGKGVLFSFLTTFGSFLIFTNISDLAGRRSMIATAVAIAVVFVTTLVVVPILFPVKKTGRRLDGSRHVPVIESRRIDATHEEPVRAGGRD